MMVWKPLQERDTADLQPFLTAKTTSDCLFFVQNSAKNSAKTQKIGNPGFGSKQKSEKQPKTALSKKVPTKSSPEK